MYFLEKLTNSLLDETRTNYSQIRLNDMGKIETMKKLLVKLREFCLFILRNIIFDKIRVKMDELNG